ncbi:MAG: tetratricopeptide repeat protein [Acidobacteria bacterium]|nr:tetratricopeptide repeat protein [Acidobacteriota bacterium]
MRDDGRILTHPAAARERFRGLVSRGAGAHLSETALVIALEQYPALDVTSYLARLDAWSRAIRERVEGSTDVERLLMAINDFLFEQEGFHGEADDYYDPRYTFLNEVIDGHAGLPITMSIVYLEISRRVGLHTVGMGIPGHFLVQLSGPWGEILVDPFDDGRVLTREECQEFMDRLYGGAVRVREHHLRSFSDEQILARLLAHLKTMYMSKGDLPGALSAFDRLMILGEAEPWDLRDRGLLAMQLHRYEEAIENLERYLQVAPSAEDAPRIRDEIRYLRDWLTLN